MREQAVVLGVMTAEVLEIGAVGVLGRRETTQIARHARVERITPAVDECGAPAVSSMPPMLGTISIAINPAKRMRA